MNDCSLCDWTNPFRYETNGLREIELWEHLHAEHGEAK